MTNIIPHQPDSEPEPLPKYAQFARDIVVPENHKDFMKMLDMMSAQTQLQEMISERKGMYFDEILEEISLRVVFIVEQKLGKSVDLNHFTSPINLLLLGSKLSEIIIAGYSIGSFWLTKKANIDCYIGVLFYSLTTQKFFRELTKEEENTVLEILRLYTLMGANILQLNLNN